jgi:ABC-2 type transport system ATP-binding protein
MAQGFGVYPDLTLAENLRYFAAMTGLPAQRAEEVLHDVDLMPQAKQLVSTLSGGQQLRASLAIALLRQPKLLVLDEPTVGLDPVLRQQLWELFRNMARQGATLLISSHIMDEASHCDHLLLLRQGKVLATGTPAELQSRTHSHDMENSFLRLVEASS